MRNFVKFSLLALVAFSATVASAAELEFHGYARAGYGFSTNGGRMTNMALVGQDTHWRLGNEADWCIEPDFNFAFATMEDKSSWGFHFMPALYRGFGAADSGIEQNALPVYFKQVYFFGSNLPWLANGQIWAGRRYWDRLQTGINDQFLENGDGMGAGISEADLGIGKLSVSFLTDNTDAWDAGAGAPVADTAIGSPYNKVGRFSVRLTGIQTFSKEAALQLWGNIGNIQFKNTDAAPGAVKADTTYHVGIYHTANLGDYGSNLLGFAYNNTKDHSDWHVVVQHGVVFSSITMGLDFLAEYRNSKNTGADAQTWLGVGARADKQISGPFRFLLEAGYDMVNKAGSVANGGPDKDTTDLRVTGALAISGGNDPWSRPTFRLFYAYQNWSDVGASTAQNFYGDKKSGGQYGVQAEGWW
jgi:maltoporin